MKRCHKIKNYWHCRKKSPKAFDPRSFRTKTLSRKTKIVVGCPRGHWRGNHCNVGMQVQKVLRRA